MVDPEADDIPMCHRASLQSSLFRSLQLTIIVSFSDMDSLPSLSSLQTALLNDPETEEELLSVMIHLLVCAIDDPGIPNPQKHLTLLGQNLRQADITNTNVTEILRIYLLARAQVNFLLCSIRGHS